MVKRYTGGIISATPPTVTANSTGLFVGIAQAVQYVQTGIFPVRPGTPTSVSAIAGDAQATVSFTAPANTGGLPILYYIVTSNPGNITATGTTSPIIVTGLTNNTSYTFTVSAVTALGFSPPSTATASVTPARYGSTLLAEVYNTGTSSALTGTFTIPNDNTTSIYVFASAGGGSGGCVFQQDNGSGAGGGGAANITGYKIAVSPGQVISYSVGEGGAARTSANDGASGGSTTLTRNATTIFNLSGGGGGQSGRAGGANGGAGGADNGYGVAGGSGGYGGVRNVRDASGGGSVTNGCGGGGGGGGHLTGRNGGAGGTSTVTASSRSFGKVDGSNITISFAGTTGGAAGGFGTTGAASESRPLAYGGNGTAQDGNTGGGGGAGAGIKPTVNGVTQANFYGAGGGGYKSYISNASTGPNGGGAGGFLIVVSMND